MSGGTDANPGRKGRTDLLDDDWLQAGPVIDSSDEFPLPSFDLEGEELDANFFPPGSEPTSEEFPSTWAGKEKSDLLDEFLLPDFDMPGPPEINTSGSTPSSKKLGPSESEDIDYFEAGLDDEAAILFPPEPPMMDLGFSSSTDSPWTITLPPQGPSSSFPDLNDALLKARAGAHLTPPGAPEASVHASEAPSSADNPTVQIKRPVVQSKPAVETAPASAQTSTVQRAVSSVAQAPERAPYQVVFDEEDEPANPQASPARGRGNNKEDLLELPVEQYVRKSQARLIGGKERKFRPWIPAVGVASLILAVTISKPLFNSMNPAPVSNPVLVVASVPQGEVFTGDTSLGKTPLALTAEDASKQLEIRKEGFEPIAVGTWEARTENAPVQKFVRALKVAPVALSWQGLPAGSVVWWNGVKTEPSSLSKSEPGKFQMKVKAKDRPVVTFPVNIEPRSKDAGPLALAALVNAELAKQPTVNVGLTLPKKKTAAKNLAINIKGQAKDSKFSTQIKVSHDKVGKVILPGPGKYQISFAGDEAYKSATQSLDLGAGSIKKVDLALVSQPPKPVAAPVSAPSATSQPSYQAPAQTYYQPSYQAPAPRYSGGGGGGGGRIAPPSF